MRRILGRDLTVLRNAHAQRCQTAGPHPKFSPFSGLPRTLMAKNRRFPRLRRPWARRVIEHRWGNFWAGCGAAPWSGPQHVVQMLPAAKRVALAVFGTVGSAVATPACAQPLLSRRGASFANRRHPGLDTARVAAPASCAARGAALAGLELDRDTIVCVARTQR